MMNTRQNRSIAAIATSTALVAACQLGPPPGKTRDSIDAAVSEARNAAAPAKVPAHVTQALTVLGNYENLRQRLRDESELLALGQGSSTNAATADGGINDTATPLLPERSPAFTAGEMLELRARLILSGRTFGGLFGPDQFSNTVAKRSMSSVDTIGHNWEMLRQRAEGRVAPHGHQ